MHSFHCKSLAVTAAYFRRLTFIMMQDKLMTMSASTIKEQKLSKHEKTAPLFFLEGQIHLYPSVYLFSMLQIC